MVSINTLLQAQPRRAVPFFGVVAGLAAALIAGVSAVPLSASSAQAEPFASHFEGVIDPIGPDMQDIDPVTPASAVDLDSFDAPIEPAPEPSGSFRALGDGVASYYGRRFHGRRTANGERFDMRAMTAAHKTLPFGSLVRVTNARNGRSVTVRINDRGPFTPGRAIDLSRSAAEQIGLVSRGHARVELELVSG